MNAPTSVFQNACKRGLSVIGGITLAATAATPVAFGAIALLINT